MLPQSLSWDLGSMLRLTAWTLFGLEPEDQGLARSLNDD